MPATERTNGNDNLSNADVALLCAIGEFTPEAGEEQQRRLERLMEAGFVEPANQMAGIGVRYQLTRKGEDFLVARGAGLNEA